MKAGVTWLSRALKRPSKSVKYLEAVSSTTFNLVPPFPKRAHIENEASETWIVHKPFSGRVDYPPHLLVMPLGYLVCNEERLVVAEELGNAATCHRGKGSHYKLLNRIRNCLVAENDRLHCFFCVAVEVLEFKS